MFFRCKAYIACQTELRSELFLFFFKSSAKKSRLYCNFISVQEEEIQ